MQEVIKLKPFECLQHFLDCFLKGLDKGFILDFNLYCFIQEEILLSHPLLLFL